MTLIAQKVKETDLEQERVRLLDSMNRILDPDVIEGINLALQIQPPSADADIDRSRIEICFAGTRRAQSTDNI